MTADDGDDMYGFDEEWEAEMREKLGETEFDTDSRADEVAAETRADQWNPDRDAQQPRDVLGVLPHREPEGCNIGFERLDVEIDGDDNTEGDSPAGQERDAQWIGEDRREEFTDRDVLFTIDDVLFVCACGPGCQPEQTGKSQRGEH
jgi:hypothetical protein